MGCVCLATLVVSRVSTYLWGLGWSSARTVAALDKRLGEGVQQAYKRYLVSGITASERANALSVREGLRVHGIAADFGARVVVGEFLRVRGTDSGYLIIDAFAAADVCSDVVVVFADSKGRTALVAWPLPLREQFMYCTLQRIGAFAVPMQEVSGLGRACEDGTIHISQEEVDRRWPSHRGELVVPEGDVAIGIRYDDGTYTNFVPLRWVVAAEKLREVPGTPITVPGAMLL